MISNTTFLNMLNAPIRSLVGKVELYNGSTLSSTFTEALKEFSVDRVGSSKFFGYGVCQKLNVKLIDRERAINIATANHLVPLLGGDGVYVATFPNFYVTDVYRSEITNELSITAYDKLYFASNYTVDDLTLNSSYTIGEFANACGNYLGLAVNLNGITAFNISYPEGANFEGTESIREALDAIAEATQTIYYVNANNVLTFKRLNSNAADVLTIDKEKYIDLDSGDNRRLSTIVHATELGDNLFVSTSASGSTQYVRDNPFWELREDIEMRLDDALAAVGGLTINQFECSWRGNPLVEIGDKIGLVNREGVTVSSFLLDDTLTFNGSLAQETRWKYEDSEEENANPTNIGDALKQTFAKVDKVNKQIDIVVSDMNATNEAISSLQLTTDGISANVSRVEQRVDTNQANIATNTNAISGLQIKDNEISASVSSVVETTNLLSGRIEANTNAISSLNMNAESISASVKKIENATNSAIKDTNNAITNLSKELDAKLTAEDLQIQISQLSVNQITTTTGFTFNQEGLTVSKSGKEMETIITDDGMRVNKSGEAVLVANNEGVIAEDLKATTFLIVGDNSRFENYGYNRTGCFWIGGND